MINSKKGRGILTRIIPYLVRAVMRSRGVDIISLALEFLQRDSAYVNHSLSVGVGTLDFVLTAKTVWGDTSFTC